VCGVSRRRIPQQIYPAATAYFAPSAGGVATTVAYQLPPGAAAGPAAPAPAAGPYSPRAVATSPAAAASPFFDLAVPGYPAGAGLATIPGAASLGFDAAYGAGFGAIPAAAGPTAGGGYLIAAGGHDGLSAAAAAAQFATAGAVPPSALTQYALHYQ